MGQRRHICLLDPRVSILNLLFYSWAFPTVIWTRALQNFASLRCFCSQSEKRQGLRGRHILQLFNFSTLRWPFALLKTPLNGI
jgi:hypothetical protein